MHSIKITPIEAEPDPVIANAMDVVDWLNADRLTTWAARVQALIDVARPVPSFDGSFPWVGENQNARGRCTVHFSPALRLHVGGGFSACVATGDPASGQGPSEQKPYHNGVEIEIVAGDGSEAVRVVRGVNHPGNYYLRLSRDCGVKLKDASFPEYPAGYVFNIDVTGGCEPLPPGTKTIIRIRNSGTPRIEAEIVEAEIVEAEPERPKFEPVKIGDTTISAGENWVEAEYQAFISAHRFSVKRARQFAYAILAAADHVDGVEVGLPLEARCERDKRDKIAFEEACTGQLKVRVFHGDKYHYGVLSTDDEAKLRAILNRRAFQGGGK